MLTNTKYIVFLQDKNSRKIKLNTKKNYYLFPVQINLYITFFYFKKYRNNIQFQHIQYNIDMNIFDNWFQNMKILSMPKNDKNKKNT